MILQNYPCFYIGRTLFDCCSFLCSWPCPLNKPFHAPNHSISPSYLNHCSSSRCTLVSWPSNQPAVTILNQSFAISNLANPIPPVSSLCCWNAHTLLPHLYALPSPIHFILYPDQLKNHTHSLSLPSLLLSTALYPTACQWHHGIHCRLLCSCYFSSLGTLIVWLLSLV